MTLNANQQGTLRNVHGQVDPFRNDLIRIFCYKGTACHFRLQLIFSMAKQYI